MFIPGVGFFWEGTGKNESDLNGNLVMTKGSVGFSSGLRTAIPTEQKLDFIIIRILLKLTLTN